MTGSNNIIDCIRDNIDVCKFSTICAEVNVPRQYLTDTPEYIYFKESYICILPMSSVYYLADIESMYV